MQPPLMTQSAHGSGRFQVKDDARIEIRRQRMSLGWTQAHLGVAMGYPEGSAKQNVSALERGEGSLEQYMNAAAALGLELEAVIVYVRTGG